MKSEDCGLLVVYLEYLDHYVCENIIFCRFGPLVDGLSKSGSRRSIEIRHYLLGLRALVLCYPVFFVEVKKLMHLYYSMDSPCADSSILNNQLGHLPLLIVHLSIFVYFLFPFDTPPFYFLGYRRGIIYLVYERSF